jgi:hypothetical protein
MRGTPLYSFVSVPCSERNLRSIGGIVTSLPEASGIEAITRLACATRGAAPQRRNTDRRTTNRPYSPRSDAHQVANAECEEETRHNDDREIGVKRIDRASRGSSGSNIGGNVARGLRAWHVLAFAFGDSMENTLALWCCSRPLLCHVHPR